MSQPATRPNAPAPLPARRRILNTFLLVLKNILGWVLILVSGPIGMAIPGPGGIPIFLVGFALITFPGKRALVSRCMRGRPIPKGSVAFRRAVLIVAIVFPPALVWYLHHKVGWRIDDRTLREVWTGIAYLLTVGLLWALGFYSRGLLNWALSKFPVIRRRVRPWLRSKGIDLLPPRRRHRLGKHRHMSADAGPTEEIIEFHDRLVARGRRLWAAARPWFIRALRLAVIGGIFVWMLKPVYRNWDTVKHDILSINPLHFLAAAAMFAIFLFVFRAISWRRIVQGFGHTLPIAPAARIWSFSELARYIPGAIWQVVGRVYLSRPYGLSTSVSSASQLLELAIFMLANVLVALACLGAAGFRKFPGDERKYVYIALAFVPILLTLIHPRIFYGVLNKILGRLGKPAVEPALRKRSLAVVVLWNVLGLLWQSLAIWILTYTVMDMPIDKWYVTAGAYCLAWTIGFSLGFFSPGGIGIRELVFIQTLRFMLSDRWVDAHFRDPAMVPAFLGFLGVLLRLWAMTGELMFAAATYVADYAGARNRPDAPGRVRPAGAPADAQPPFAPQTEASG